MLTVWVELVFLWHAKGAMAGRVAEFGREAGILPLRLPSGRSTVCPRCRRKGEIPRADAGL